MKNIAFNYSLEHDSTEDLFTSVFHWLHVLEEERGDTADVLREVILCIGTIQSSICHHMLKEERQVCRFCLPHNLIVFCNIFLEIIFLLIFALS